ncbi:hypothetical protein FPV67DRAFT_601735 [Lyophyllum atratum]|nr:hypothetical protein FPV67DRAFT_601735 [Lyophyllum atratum]
MCNEDLDSLPQYDFHGLGEASDSDTDSESLSSLPETPTKSPSTCKLPSPCLQGLASKAAFDQEESSNEEFDRERLEELTSRQAVLETWMEYVKATDTYILIEQAWIGGDKCYSSDANANASPQAIKSIWSGRHVADAPYWVRWAPDTFASEVTSLEQAIRGMSRLARDPCNAAISNQLIDWALCYTRDPLGFCYHQFSPSTTWRAVTPDRPPIPRSARRRVNRIRYSIE